MTRSQSGELTFTQAGIMLLVIGAGLFAAELATTDGRWIWNGIPVIYFAGGFAALGVVALIAGIVRKA